MLARPGRAWSKTKKETSSEGALDGHERSFGAWIFIATSQALPGLANIEGSFGAKTDHSP